MYACTFNGKDFTRKNVLHKALTVFLRAGNMADLSDLPQSANCEKLLYFLYDSHFLFLSNNKIYSY